MEIGVALPMAENGDLGTTARYREIRDLALLSEQLGFDSVWMFDHLIYRFGDPPKTSGIWEIWTMLAAIAEATERVKLGTLVMCVPFRNPALLAKMADTLDEISNGRLILGIGAGWHKPEFDAFGYPFDHLASRFEDGLHIIRGLLRNGTVDYTGEFESAPNCELRPMGPRTGQGREGSIPILIGAGKPRMLKLTAEHADMWNTCWLGTPDLLAERRQNLEAACAEVGRDPKTLQVTVGVVVHYPEHQAQLLADNNPSPEENPELPPPERAFVGSPDEVADLLKRYEDLGVSQLQVIPDPMIPASYKAFGQAVNLYRG